MLPYLEMTVDDGMAELVPDADGMCSSLIDGRREVAGRTDVMLALRRAEISAPVRSFLRRWVRRETSVLPPRE
jgi:hypothetical protein